MNGDDDDDDCQYNTHKHSIKKRYLKKILSNSRIVPRLNRLDSSLPEPKIQERQSYCFDSFFSISIFYIISRVAHTQTQTKGQ